MKKKKILNLLFCLGISFILITLCSRNSFLYRFNDWVDANAFFTMGKGWMNGLVPYKDLFEQKGPILYLIYGIGYLISNSNFIGVYTLEIISFTVFNYFGLKILETIIENKYRYPIMTITSTVIVTTLFFVQGGSAEEFCLPLIAYNFYSFQRYQTKDFKYDKKILFINGMVAGVISLIKFNLLGFWFIWMAFVFFVNIYNKKIKDAFKSCIPFLIGMVTPILVFSIYFIINGAFKDFIECYITFNFGAYTTDITLKQRIKDFIINFMYHFKYEPIIFHLIIFGFLSMILNNKIFKNVLLKLFTIVSFLFLGLGIYIGGVPYNYYFLVNEFYIIFGLAIIFILIKDKFYKADKYNIKYILLIIITLLACSWQISKSNKLNDMNLSKDNFAQYTFLNKIKDHTLLNYDNLDGGFYTTANIIPSTKYFMRQNVSYEKYPKIMDEQNKIIRYSEVDYIIIREYFDNIDYHLYIPYLNDNYKIIETKTQIYEGMEFTYFLYERKDI